MKKLSVGCMLYVFIFLLIFIAVISIFSSTSEEENKKLENDTININKFNNLNLGSPLDTLMYITSPYGTRDLVIAGRSFAKHNGIDLVRADENVGSDDIYSINDGIVVHTNNTFESKDLGNFVLIKSENYYYLYAHLSLVVVDTGMSVKKGEKIGVMGATGSVTGKHLHFAAGTGVLSGYISPNSFLDKEKIVNWKYFYE